MTIILAGGSGFVGGALTKALLARGDTVIVVDLVAPKINNEKLFFIPCDLSRQTIPFGVLEHADAVVNLSGATIAQKWTDISKQTIYDSRILSTKNIIKSLEETKVRPAVFVSASAIGIYGETGKAVSDEKSPLGEGFLASVVHDWESEAQKASEFGVRVVSVRTAPVLGQYGMLGLYTRTARFGFLLGLKKDFAMSWIHIDDLVNVYIFAIETSTVQGAINAAAPETTSYKELMYKVGRVIHRKAFLFLPRKIAEYVLGAEGYDELTKNQLAVPTKLLSKGFVFLYPDLIGALAQIYHSNTKKK